MWNDQIEREFRRAQMFNVRAMLSNACEVYGYAALTLLCVSLGAWLRSEPAWQYCLECAVGFSILWLIVRVAWSILTRIALMRIARWSKRYPSSAKLA